MDRAKKLATEFRELIRRGEYDNDRPRPGEVREATILAIGERDLVVDLGAKRDGIVPPKDLQFVDDEYLSSLVLGDRIPVVAMRRRLYGDGIRVSLNKGLQGQDWLRAQELLETGEIVKATVLEPNRGGVLVLFGNLRGFVPNSHLGSLAPRRDAQSLQDAKSTLVGETLSLVIIDVNQRRRRLVLSRKPVERRFRRKVLEELEPGQVRTGTVANLVDFGAFVDLGGIDGLIHISKLDWGHVNHPSDVLQVGDTVRVYVDRVDRERQRISLDRKRLLPDPWDIVTRDLQPGDRVAGTITNVVSFGVFVDIGQGVEGLVHKSRLPRQSTMAHPELVIGLGIVVEVLHISPERQQLALRLCEEDELSDERKEKSWQEAPTELAVGREWRVCPGEMHVDHALTDARDSNWQWALRIR